MANVVKLNAKHSFEPPHLWEVLDILPVAVMISADRESARIVGNVAARALLNATPIQNLSRSATEEKKPPFQVYAKGHLIPADELPMQKAAATGLPVPRSECELRFDSGQRIFIAGHSVPVFDDSGVAKPTEVGRIALVEVSRPQPTLVANDVEAVIRGLEAQLVREIEVICGSQRR